MKDHEYLNDFELGWFLHLITDYLFFEECFDTEYLLENSYEQFCKDLYFAYGHLNLYLSDKYEYYSGVPYEECILSRDLIDTFINRVSSIDLEKYIKKIQKIRSNVKP